MHGLSYPTATEWTVLSNKITKARIVISFKDSPRRPLGRRRPEIDPDLEDEGEVEGVLVDAALDVLEPPVHRVLLRRLLRRQPELGYLSQRLVAAKRVCKYEPGSGCEPQEH